MKSRRVTEVWVQLRAFLSEAGSWRCIPSLYQICAHRVAGRSVLGSLGQSQRFAGEVGGVVMSANGLTVYDEHQTENRCH